MIRENPNLTIQTRRIVDEVAHIEHYLSSGLSSLVLAYEGSKNTPEPLLTSEVKDFILIMIGFLEERKKISVKKVDNSTNAEKVQTRISKLKQIFKNLELKKDIDPTEPKTIEEIKSVFS